MHYSSKIVLYVQRCCPGWVCWLSRMRASWPARLCRRGRQWSSRIVTRVPARGSATRGEGAGSLIFVDMRGVSRLQTAVFDDLQVGSKLPAGARSCRWPASEWSRAMSRTSSPTVLVATELAREHKIWYFLSSSSCPYARGGGPGVMAAGWQCNAVWAGG